jgi:hypothetical protein
MARRISDLHGLQCMAIGEAKWLCLVCATYWQGNAMQWRSGFYYHPYQHTVSPEIVFSAILIVYRPNNWAKCEFSAPGLNEARSTVRSKCYDQASRKSPVWGSAAAHNLVTSLCPKIGPRERPSGQFAAVQRPASIFIDIGCIAERQKLDRKASRNSHSN